MTDIVIKVELSAAFSRPKGVKPCKSYIIGHEKRERYTALRDVMVNKVKNIAGKTRQIFKGGQLIAGSEVLCLTIYPAYHLTTWNEFALL